MRCFSCLWRVALVGLVLLGMAGCGTTTGGEVVRVTEVHGDPLGSLDAEDLQKVNEFRQSRTGANDPGPFGEAAAGAPLSYSVAEYLSTFSKSAAGASGDYRIGGYDILTIYVYDEEDLSRKGVPVSADGYISFPLVGRVEVEGLSTSEVEDLIRRKLAEGQYLLDANVSVVVEGYKSKKYSVLGAVKSPGTFPLEGRERLLDAVSSAGGIDSAEAGKQATIIRSVSSPGAREQKISIRLDMDELLRGNDQISNLSLQDKDVVYIPKAELFYIMGQVNRPGSYKIDKDTSLVEAIGMAGGFTPIAASKKTRIIRAENGTEKIIQVNVDAITKAGKKIQDVSIKPNDIIVVPESFL